MKVKEAIKKMDECKSLINTLEGKIKEYDSKNPTEFNVDLDAISLSLAQAFALIDICQDYSFLISIQEVKMNWKEKEEKLPF